MKEREKDQYEMLEIQGNVENQCGYLLVIKMKWRRKKN